MKLQFPLTDIMKIKDRDQRAMGFAMAGIYAQLEEIKTILTNEYARQAADREQLQKAREVL